MFFFETVRADFNARVRFAVSDVVGQQFVTCAEINVETAHFETGVDATYRDVEPEIVVAQFRVCVNRAIVLAVDVFDVAVFVVVYAFDLVFDAVINEPRVALYEGVRLHQLAVLFVESLEAAQIEVLRDADVDKSVIIGVGMDIFAVRFAVHLNIEYAFLDKSVARHVHACERIVVRSVRSVHQSFAFEIIIFADD